MVMGCVPSKTEDERKAEEISKKIDRQLKEDAAIANRKVKLLLLGAADSGKSTIAKQLRILHQGGFSDEDRKGYLSLVHRNALESMKDIVSAMKTLNVRYENEELEKDAEKVLDAYATMSTSSYQLSTVAAQSIKNLWKDAGIQSCFHRSREYQLNDSAKYFLDDIDRLAESDYVPSEQDVLRTRLLSRSIVETSFNYKNLDFTLIDVAGHRSERRKWIHHFQEVTAIVFCVAMSDYDRVLLEDDTTNRMEDSLKLFDSVCNNQLFVNTAIILFLNKKDIFQDKVSKSPICQFFPNFKGRNTYEEGSMFFRRLFEDANDEKKREIFTHFTCATDTNNVRFVFDVVSDVISSKIMNDVF